jgi:RNA polymerase sigma factor (sigma-70 family)
LPGNSPQFKIHCTQFSFARFESVRGDISRQAALPSTEVPVADKPNEFAALMERVAQGDKQALAEVYEKYHKAIRMVVRYRLNKYPQLRTLNDSMDFVQMLWQDLLAEPEKLDEFSTIERLLKYLAVRIEHKIEKVQRKYTAQKRDLRRRRHLSAPGVAVAAAAVTDPRPDPAQQAASHEAWERWSLSLPERHRQVIIMLRDGFTYDEIAAELCCSMRTIKRLVAKLRNMLPPEPLP